MIKSQKSDANSSDPVAQLGENARDFLNGGLRLLLAERASKQDAKLGVVSIQVAAELFAKHRLARTRGLQRIAKGRLSERSAVKLARVGQLKTIGYSKCLALISKEEFPTSGDLLALQAVRDLRNALVHFVASINIDEVRMRSAWMLIRVLAMFAAAEQRDIGEFQTHSRFLDPDNYQKLIRLRAYRDEAVDAAIENIDTEETLRCWECGAHTLTIRATDTLFCWCCGLTVDSSAVSHEDCDLCDSPKGIFYDPHNPTDGCYRGKCTECDTFVWLYYCDECLEVSVVPEHAGPTLCTSCDS